MISKPADTLVEPTPTPAVAAKPKRPSKAAPKDIPPIALPPATPARQSKQAQLIASLRTPSGMTIAQMMTLTGWQAHTVRGTISGALRKKLGLTVICEPATAGGPRLYRIIESAVAV